MNDQYGESCTPVLGQNYFVRTITDYWVGRCVGVGPNNKIRLAEPAWVAVTGRLNEFMKNGEAPNMEVEPIWQKITVQYLAIIDWPHKLFDEAV